MSDTPPPSLLITPDTRRRLQQRYEEAVRLMAARPCDYARVHDLLGECLRADPGNILYLDTLLANLRKPSPKPQSWFARFFRAPQPAASHTPSNIERSFQQAVKGENWNEVLGLGPQILALERRPPIALNALATAAGALGLRDIELRYWRASVDDWGGNHFGQRGLARALTRRGLFDEAATLWIGLALHDKDDESRQALSDIHHGLEFEERKASAAEQAITAEPMSAANYLRLSDLFVAAGRFDDAERTLTDAQSATGNDLRVREARESLRLDRSSHQIAVARRRAMSDPHPQAQELVGDLLAEHNRLEIDILHLRSERHPDDLLLRLELARRLKKAGNYSGAIQRLEEARAERALAAAVLLELGECWQHLRQFGKALEFYRQVVEREIHSDETPADASPRPLVGALYRIGVLAAAMDRPDEAKVALSRLLTIDPGYKDARQRLDKLP